MTTKLSRALAAAVVLFAISAVPRSSQSADAVSKASCLAGHETGQKLRRDGKLVDARAQFLICAQAGCPAALQSECSPWVKDVDARIPTVVVSIVDPKGQHVDATVSMNGQPFTQLDGRAAQLDPGKATFVVDAAGWPKLTHDVLVREGEKGRIIEIKLEKAAPTAATTSAPPLPAERPAEAPSRGVPTATWVLGGVAVVGLASFAFFGSKAKSQVNDLSATCGHRCPQDDVDAAKQKALIADVSLGIALASTVGAIWVFRSSTAPVKVEAAIGPRQVGLAGQF